MSAVVSRRSDSPKCRIPLDISSDGDTIVLGSVLILMEVCDE